jgi:hypothetical protein
MNMRCTRCKNEARVGKTTCLQCQQKRSAIALRYRTNKRKELAEFQRNLRNNRKKLGRCIYCNGPSRPGKNTCSVCQKKRQKSVSKWKNNNRDTFNTITNKRYHTHKRSGKCVKCTNFALSGKTLCQKCSLSTSVTTRKHYVKCRSKQKCVNCGENSISCLCDHCKSSRTKYIQSPSVIIKQREWRENRWQKILFSTLLARAKKKGIYVDPELKWSDLPDPNGQKCPIFGSSYIMGSGDKCDSSATIDRIRPELGYVKGNLQLLSSLANTIKNNASPEIIEMVGKAVQSKKNKSNIVMDMCDKTKERRQKMIIAKKAQNKRKRNLDFDIQWFNINLPKVCPCTGVIIDYENNQNDWRFWPSIDRIDNNIGYIPGNVWVISAWANAIKSNANESQILAVADWLRITNQPSER